MVKEEAKEPVKFELKNPVSATSGAVQCREDVVRVKVKQDFLGKGPPIVRTNEVGVECHYQS